MKGFAYMYTVLILSVVVISITAYFLVSYSTTIEGVHTYSSTKYCEYIGLIPSMYGIVASGLNATVENLLGENSRILSQYFTSPSSSVNSFSEEVELHGIYGKLIYESFTRYSSLMDEAVSSYGIPTALMKLSNISILRYSVMYGYQRSFVNLTYLIIPANMTANFLVTAPQSQIGNVTIPISLVVSNHKVRLNLGTLSVYDVALNVSLEAYNKIGGYIIPATFKKVSAWKLTYTGTRFVLSDKIPVDVLDVGASYINFKVGISLFQRVTYIFIEVELTTGESIYIVSEIYMAGGVR